MHNWIMAHSRRAMCLCLGCLTPLVALSEETASRAEWRQWRGPSRDGQITAGAWPDSVDKDGLKRIWRVEAGPSYSGPIVTSDRVFVTETKDEKVEVVRALDRKTGNKIWEANWAGAIKVPFFARANGDWIRATPAYDGERLYVAGMRDVLVCLDGNTGEEHWRVDFVKEFGSSLPAFGFVCSPLVIGDFVYVQAGSAFVKIKTLTGEVVWRTLQDGGGTYGSAFSSPFFATIRDTPQILVQTRQSLVGVDPDSGSVLWKQDIPAFRGMNILTPTVVGDSVFTSSYGGRSFMYSVIKRDDGWEVAEAWTNKVQGYMSSPIVIDDHIYLHLKNQRLTCMDVATGRERWTTKPFGKYWSMVTNGRQILALDQQGELLLIRANPEKFELISRRRIADDSWAHVAVCGKEIYVRELNALSLYRWD